MSNNNIEEDYRPDSNDRLKTATIILSIAVAILAGLLIYAYTKQIPLQKTEISQLSSEKDNLMYQLQNIRAQYDDLKTDNDTLSAQLETEKQKVDLMIEKLKKTEASNKARIREYEKELGTLRDIMRGYIHQIDSLNTLTAKLRTEASMARAVARESDEKYQNLVQATDHLVQKVEEGAKVRARDIQVIPINEKNKEVAKATNTVKLKTCLTLTENSLADKGPRSIFIRVKGPDGILITLSENNIFRAEEGQLIYSAVREIDYQGEDIEVCIFYGSNNEKFAKGVYTVDVFSGGILIGTGQTLLK